jgi:hypothetical protein
MDSFIEDHIECYTLEGVENIKARMKAKK